jgi:hypothetical protein
MTTVSTHISTFSPVRCAGSMTLVVADAAKAADGNGNALAARYAP